MPYCSACSAEVPEDAAACPRCRTIFGSSPASQPRATLPPPAAKVAEAVEAADDAAADGPKRAAGPDKSQIVLRSLVTAPLLIAGVVLLLVAARLGDNGGLLLAMPGGLCLYSAITIARAKNTRSLTHSMIVGILLLLLLWGLIQIIGAAIYSR